MRVGAGVPPLAKVVYELELLRWEETITTRVGMSAALRLTEATALKGRGTDAFQAKRYAPSSPTATQRWPSPPPPRRRRRRNDAADWMLTVRCAMLTSRHSPCPAVQI